MEMSLIKSGCYNEHHIEIWLPYFSFSPLFRAMLKFWSPYGYRMLVKISLLGVLYTRGTWQEAKTFTACDWSKLRNLLKLALTPKDLSWFWK
jgi:hypothetical protein